MYGDDRRVADHLFTASESLNGDHLPREARLPSGNSWCTTELGFSTKDPFLEINFGTDVIIQIIEVSGNVTQFHLQYSTIEESELHFVIKEDSTDLQVCYMYNQHLLS